MASHCLRAAAERNTQQDHDPLRLIKILFPNEPWCLSQAVSHQPLRAIPRSRRPQPHKAPVNASAQSAVTAADEDFRRLRILG
jgi:hypothetical protein